MKTTNFEKSRWTAEEIATLRFLSKDTPVREVAAIMGRTYGAVRGKMERLGLDAFSGKEWRPWGAAEVDFLIDNHQTMTVADIATALNRTENSVKDKCFWLRLSLAKRKYSDEDVSLCRQLFAAGVSRRDIAEKMEIPYDRVVAWILGRHRNIVQ